MSQGLLSPEFRATLTRMLTERDPLFGKAKAINPRPNQGKPGERKHDCDQFSTRPPHTKAAADKMAEALARRPAKPPGER